MHYVSRFVRASDYFFFLQKSCHLPFFKHHADIIRDEHWKVDHSIDKQSERKMLRLWGGIVLPELPESDILTWNWFNWPGSLSVQVTRSKTCTWAESISYSVLGQGRGSKNYTCPPAAIWCFFFIESKISNWSISYTMFLCAKFANKCWFREMSFKWLHRYILSCLLQAV